MNNKGLLIVISGPSGAGKGTICRELLGRNISNLELSISATTRMPRTGEIDGVSYFFKDKDEFRKMIDGNDLLEYAQVHDNFYGTPKQYVMDKMHEGKDIILEIDIQGAMKIKQQYRDAVFIFIMPPSYEELKNRIVGRGTECEQEIEKRLKNAREEVRLAPYYEYVIINDDIKTAADKLNCIIIAEKCKIDRCHIDFENYN